MRRREIDTTLERRILIGLIVSDVFCRKVLPVVRVEYFTLPYARRIITWVREYYEKYEKAPFRHIQDIFEVERSRIKPAEAELIEEFLFTLSKQYEGESDLNVDYLVDQAFFYFRKRSLEILSDSIRVYLDRDEVEEAESVLRGYKEVAREVGGWENPFDPGTLLEVFETENVELFRFPGVLGEFVGPLERGWLVGVMGPFKRGKSWMLQEFAVQAVVSGRRTLYISLEMPARQVKSRLIKRIAGKGFEEGDFLYPVFDCKKNQYGTCTRTERASKVSLKKKRKELYSFTEAPKDYKPCTYCREHKLPDYEPALWFTTMKKTKLSYQEAVRVAESFTLMYGDKLRIKSYPAFSATVFQVMSDIENLEYAEDFVPDVIVIDYADIMRSTSRDEDFWVKIDEIWKTLKRLAMEKHCLVVTGTQTNRGALSKKSVSQEDTAEDIQKLGHVDLLLTLNQTPKEKEAGLMRVGILAKREGDFSTLKQVAILTNLKTGQFLLDSEWWEVPEEEK